jgi:hypothetical protein
VPSPIRKAMKKGWHKIREGRNEACACRRHRHDERLHGEKPGEDMLIIVNVLYGSVIRLTDVLSTSRVWGEFEKSEGVGEAGEALRSVLEFRRRAERKTVQTPRFNEA